MDAYHILVVDIAKKDMPSLVGVVGKVFHEDVVVESLLLEVKKYA